MKTTALRIYGKKDLRVETFELPPLKDDELLVKMVVDSICMSSYKAALLGEDHRRVPDNVKENPTIVGHEFCGEIVEVGAKWKNKYKPGERFIIQTAMKETYEAIGYSYANIGGNGTYGIVPGFVVEGGYVLPYEGDAFYYGALTEPISCVIGAAHSCYHTIKSEYTHVMEPVEGGNMAALAGVGPMGLAFIDYIIHRKQKPGMLVVTDIDDKRLARAAKLLSPEMAAKEGVKLVYVNTGGMEDPVSSLKEYTNGEGFNDVIVFAPVKSVVEQADALLAYDGCLNFFAGPSDTQFSASMNFYNVHYYSTHIVATNGGNVDDMLEGLSMSTKKQIDPSILVTHIGGIDAAAESVLNLPNIPGGKKLIYNHIKLPLTAIDDFAEKGKSNPLFAKLAEICDRNDGLWSLEAEQYLLANAEPLDA
ncbi:zinc-binding dehydrogenase [Christensenellaceae bacterium OttesenSCG-928-K19]|nr:zinc-binding dehydrogenase [Christensenellaceae bacterium OttesenSCG-928-K19]